LKIGFNGYRQQLQRQVGSQCSSMIKIQEYMFLKIAKEKLISIGIKRLF
jgi:hypothetical protein